jgi:hypothetical protein
MTTLKEITMLTVAMALAVCGRTESRVQAQTANVEPQLEELIRLSGSVRTRDAAATQYQRLRDAAPTDVRVPRLYGLLLIKQRHYREASHVLRESLRLNGSDLNIRKVSIWLTVLHKDYDGAIEAMDGLCRRMPRETRSAEQERKCREFAIFVGQITGYLTGPGYGRLGAGRYSTYVQSITQGLSDERRAVAEIARQQVFEAYRSGLQQLDGLQQAADANEMMVRNLEKSQLAQDRDYTWAELKRIEDLRSEAKARASNERNVIAATRERSAGSFGSGDSASTRNRQEMGPFYRVAPGSLRYDQHNGRWNVNPNNPQLILDHSADRYAASHQQGGSGGVYYLERGLGDNALLDVNLREAQNDRRLDRRDQTLNTRHGRITSDEKRLLTKPAIGFNSQLTALRAKVEALTTYVPLPVSADREVARILASFHQETAAPVEFAMSRR